MSSPQPTASAAVPTLSPNLVAMPLWSIAVLFTSFLVMYVPCYIVLADTVWGTDEQGHGPLILMASAWLLWDGRRKIFCVAPQPALVSGFSVLILGLVLFVLGRSQSVIEIEVSSQILILISSILLLQGRVGLKNAWFPLFFLIFMIPLPPALVQSLTLPLKSAVSVVVEQLLYTAGYPIGRAGVTLTIGGYHLLVADACSGLNSLFTLESLGLLYMNIMKYKSKARNIFIATMIVPISFFSNVIRVIVLVLVTFYFGDEAGQGFVHDFAGLVLFSVALILTYGMDRLIAKRFDKMGGARENS